MSEKEEKLKQVLYDIVFAYANKDDEFPHGFERQALEQAEELLTGDHKIFCSDVLQDVINKMQVT